MIDPGDGGDRQEHLVLPQAVIQRQVSYQGRGAEITLSQIAIQQNLAAGQDFPILRELFSEFLIILVRTLVDHRTQVHIAVGRIADNQLLCQLDQARHQTVIHGCPSMYTREQAEHF